MLPLSRLDLLPWVEHAPGSFVFAQTYHGVCAALRVTVPHRGDDPTPGLLLLAEAPWNDARAPDRSNGPGHVIAADGRDDPFEGLAFGIPASELQVEFDPKSLVLPSRVTRNGLGTFSLRRNGRPALLGGENAFSQRWQRPFDVLSGLPLPESDREAPVAYSPAWAMTLSLGDGRLWRFDVAVPLNDG